MTQSTAIVLASGSPYRKALMERLHLDFSVEAAAIDETPDAAEPPWRWAEILAARKAQTIAMKHPQALVIGSDQVAEFDNCIIGKPGSAEAAVEQLMSFSGRSVAFHSGVALISMTRNLSISAVETLRVQFRQLQRAEVEDYVAIEEPLDCCGSFKGENLGISLLRRIEGEDPTTLIGLPLIRLCDMLRKAGVDLPSAAR